MKQCVSCKQVKLFDEFNKNKTRKDGLQSYCRTCSHAKFAKYYNSNKARHRLDVYEDRARKLAEYRQRLWSYLSNHPCVDCGEADPVVLEFDHVRDIKVDAVTTMLTSGASWERVLTEIAKCDVRCSNCHKKVTFKRSGSWRHTAALFYKRKTH